jgi:hypothetical protein
VSAADLVRDYGALVGLAGVTITLYVNGRRTDRTVRRETRARAIEAVVAYQEMPYAIRRRRHEAEHRSAERVRLTEAFTVIQAELASCEALMRADTEARVRDGYAHLVATLRTCAGKHASLAWDSTPIKRDEDMRMPEVFEALAPVRKAQHAFEDVVAQASRRRRDPRRWLPRRSVPALSP